MGRKSFKTIKQRPRNFLQILLCEAVNYRGTLLIRSPIQKKMATLISRQAQISWLEGHNDKYTV